jgi:hypothetical protein
VPRRGEPLAPPFVIKPDGCYLITGAFGGFGKVLAEWLVKCGARHLVLSSRSGAATPAAEALVQSLRHRGVNVKVVRADAGSSNDVSRLLAEIRAGDQSLRGVFHLAMVIDDAPLAALSRERLRTVMAPKAYGAWLLHKGTQHLPLDCFVMFSSISSIFGNPAQGNYCAANAFLDSLAHHRRALGLPALTMNWGVLGGEGYVARNERVAEFLARQGTTELSPGEVMSLLESSLVAGNTQVAAIRVDWAKWRQFFRSLHENPLLERILASIEGQEGGSVKSDWRLLIESAAPEDRESIITAAVRDVIGAVLRVKPDSLRNDQPLTDLGLDSLMGVEIENSLEAPSVASAYQLMRSLHRPDRVAHRRPHGAATPALRPRVGGPGDRDVDLEVVRRRHRQLLHATAGGFPSKRSRASQPSGHHVRRQTRSFETAGERQPPPSAHSANCGSIAGGGADWQAILRLHKGRITLRKGDGPPAVLAAGAMRISFLPGGSALD